ncbi:hypothetical protein HDU97_006120 [Phlyctochytrium planicorne]|nr:hypothetical protein HDU97_006120 [Phlyctochytrium planicorne]
MMRFYILRNGLPSLIISLRLTEGVTDAAEIDDRIRAPDLEKRPAKTESEIIDEPNEKLQQLNVSEVNNTNNNNTNYDSSMVDKAGDGKEHRQQERHG